MAVDTLIKRLQEKKDEQIKHLWHEAEKKAAAMRKESAASSHALLQGKAHELTAISDTEKLPILKKAKQKSHQTILKGQEKILMRAYKLARNSLVQLKTDQYPLQFTRLANEIPGTDWHQVSVHPDDNALAQQSFPNVNIHLEKLISGGVLLRSKDGKIEIDNSFEKRLDKLWPYIAPLILQDINQQFHLLADDE